MRLGPSKRSEFQMAPRSRLENVRRTGRRGIGEKAESASLQLCRCGLHLGARCAECCTAAYETADLGSAQMPSAFQASRVKTQVENAFPQTSFFVGSPHLPVYSPVRSVSGPAGRLSGDRWGNRLDIIPSANGERSGSPNIVPLQDAAGP